MQPWDQGRLPRGSHMLSPNPKELWEVEVGRPEAFPSSWSSRNPSHISAGGGPPASCTAPSKSAGSVNAWLSTLNKFFLLLTPSLPHLTS